MEELIFKDNKIIIQKSDDVMSLFKGGEGSGHFDYLGRFGFIGGSLPKDIEEAINNKRFNFNNRNNIYKKLYGEDVADGVYQSLYYFIDSGNKKSPLENFVANRLNRNDVDHDLKKDFKNEKVQKAVESEIAFNKIIFEKDFPNGVDMYRGVKGELAKKIYEAKLKGLNKIRVKTTALESFSLSKGIATVFTDPTRVSKYGVVIKKNFDSKNVINYYKTRKSMGNESEQEIMIGFKDKYLTIRLDDVDLYDFRGKVNLNKEELKNNDIIGDLGDDENIHWIQKINKQKNSNSDDVMSLFKGGSGSGNFGHSGRIGEVGGSGEEIISNDKLIKLIDETDKLQSKNYMLRYLDNKVEYIKNKINPNMSKEDVVKIRSRIYDYISEGDKNKSLLGNVKIDKAYLNEHAARLKNPDNFDSFARKNNRFGEGIHAIFGIKDNKATIQSIRFNKDKYGVNEAKKWLKEHNYSPISFEPAIQTGRINFGKQDNDVMSLFKDGEGSGNFGHSGRPGEVGGSDSDGGNEGIKNIDGKSDLSNKANDVKKWQDIVKLKEYGIRWNPEGDIFLPSTSRFRVLMPDNENKYFGSFKDFKNKILVPLSQGRDVNLTSLNAEKEGSMVLGVKPESIDKLKGMGYEITTTGKIYKLDEFINYGGK